MPITWVPQEELRALAREVGIYLVGGYAEPCDDEGERCYSSLT